MPAEPIRGLRPTMREFVDLTHAKGEAIHARIRELAEGQGRHTVHAAITVLVAEVAAIKAALEVQGIAPVEVEAEADGQ